MERFHFLLMSFKSFLDIIFIAQFRRIKFQDGFRELSNFNHNNNQFLKVEFKNFDDRLVVFKKQCGTMRHSENKSTIS